MEKDAALVTASTYKCSTHELLLGLLTAVGSCGVCDGQMKEELPDPLYFSFHGVTSVLKMTAPKYVEVRVGAACEA